jgi:signal recognition particle subunit SRP54
MFDNLSDKLDKAFHILKGTENMKVVAENFKRSTSYLMPMWISKDFTTRVKRKSTGQNVLHYFAARTVIGKVGQRWT